MASNAAQQVVDAQALAASIVQGVFSRLDQQGMTGAAPTRAERKSDFQEKAAELLKAGKIGEDVAPTLMTLMEAMNADMSAKQRAEAEDASRKANAIAVHGEIDRMIERFASASKNPELMRDLSPTIKQRAISDFNASEHARTFDATGAMNWGFMEKAILKQIQKYGATEDGGTKEKPAGGVPMKNSAPEGASEPSSSLTADDLDETQREIYNAQVSFAKKQMNMPREDAEKRALKLINDAEIKRKNNKSRR